MAKPTTAVQSESDIQKMVAQYLNACGVLWAHTPNEGYRHIATARRLRAEGVQRGVPDILIYTPPPLCLPARGAAIELKKVRGGRLSPHQAQWLKNLGDVGWVTAVCRGFDDAISQLQKWGYCPNFRRGESS